MKNRGGQKRATFKNDNSPSPKREDLLWNDPLSPDKDEVREALGRVQRALARGQTEGVEYRLREELFDNFYRAKRSPSTKQFTRSKHAASLERFEELENKRQKKLEAMRAEKLRLEEASISDIPLTNSNIKAKSLYKNPIHSQSKPNIISRARQLELENLRECTFKPDLSATKKRGGSKSREASEDPTISDFYEDKGRTPNQLLEWGQEKESKLAQLRLLHANDENVITQNVPKINTKSKQLKLKGKYVPLQERVNDCLESKAQFIKELGDKKYKCSFTPATNERSKEILKQRDQRLDIENQLEEDMKERIRRKAVEMSLPGFSNKSKEEIYFGDKKGKQEGWRQHHKREKSKYPEGVTEELIKRNFSRGVAHIASRSQSLR